MTTITKLEPKTYQGKAQGFTVTLSDGRNGNLEEKQSDKGLRVGDDVFVMEIPYTSKAGKASILYGLKLTTGTPVSQPSQGLTTPPPPRPAIHVGAGKTKEELKADASIAMASACLQAVKEDKLDFGQVAEKQTFMSKLLWGEIDEIFSSKV